MVWLYAMSMFATTVACLVTIALSYRQFHRRIGKLFLAIAILVSIWSFCRGLSASVADHALALQLIRMAYIGSIYLPMAFCEFTLEFLEIKKRPLYIGILYVAVVAISMFSFSHLF